MWKRLEIIKSLLRRAEIFFISVESFEADKILSKVSWTSIRNLDYSMFGNSSKSVSWRKDEPRQTSFGLIILLRQFDSNHHHHHLSDINKSFRHGNNKKFLQ